VSEFWNDGTSKTVGVAGQPAEKDFCNLEGPRKEGKMSKGAKLFLF
jgi:hypothetical protein